MKTISTILLALIAVAGIPVLATAAGHAHPAPAETTQTAELKAVVQPQSEGDIKKIDKKAGKITLKHGRIANLNMPAMTMVFKVKESTMLDQVKVGDKVKFTAEKMNGAITVTALQGATSVAAATTTDGASDAEKKTDTQAQTDGEIKKVDKGAGKVTVKHGPLVNLDMPAMTMVFKVKDPAMLEQVKAGDKVKFTVEKINGAFTITALRSAT